MALETRAITARRKQQIYELTTLLAKLAVEGRIPRDEFLKTVKGVIRRFVPDALPEPKAEQEPTHSRAEARRAKVEAWYHALGFQISVPRLYASNREYLRRLKLGQDLFYRPASLLVSYDAFMQAVGQAQHWTLRHADVREWIGWESTPIGYWFWAEVAPKCPRISTSWEARGKAQRISLEEYVIVQHETNFKTTIKPDFNGRICTLFRTQYSGSYVIALGTERFNGEVVAFNFRDELADDCGNLCGRLVERIAA